MREFPKLTELDLDDFADTAAQQAAFVADREAWFTERHESEKELPRHALAGSWLKANPTPGVECVDRADGLGPRLLGWVGAAPDITAWAATYVPPEQAAQAAKAAKLAALEAAKDSLDKASTVAGVRTAAAAAIAALEARLAALEGR